MRFFLAAAVLLAACSTPRPQEMPPPALPQRAGVDPIVAARAEGVEFRAVGEGVALDIFRADRIRLTMTSTSEVLFFPKPAPQYPRWNGSIYETSTDAHTLRIEIRNYLTCERPDRTTYPITVNITLDGREIHACGRSF
jgi:hypothetical protein